MGMRREEGEVEWRREGRVARGKVELGEGSSKEKEKWRQGRGEEEP